jgi:outer membrane protein assembly factor BamB
MANPGWTALTIDDGVIYAALASGQIVALDASGGGDQLWLYPQRQASSSPIGCSIAKTTDGPAEGPLDAVYGRPALTEDLVIVSSYDEHLHAFDRLTGEKVWQYPPSGSSIETAPLVGGVQLVDGVAYFGSSEGQVTALDIETREPVWERPFAAGSRVWGTPAVDEQHVYFGSMDHYVYAVDRESGREVWRSDLGGSVPGSVTLDQGVLYVGVIDQRLHALDARTGQELWRTDRLGAWVWGEALVHEGYVYFGTLGGQVYAYDLATQERRWAPIEVEGAVRAGPSVIDGSLIVGTDANRAYRINIEKGSVVDFPPIDGAVLSMPAIEGTDLYLATASGKVYAYDLERDIAQRWVYPPQKN